MDGWGTRERWKPDCLVLLGYAMRDQMATMLAGRTNAVIDGTSGRVSWGMVTSRRARRRENGALGPLRREDCGHQLREVRGTTCFASGKVQEVQGLDEAGVDVEGLRLNEGRWKGILCNLTRFGSAQVSDEKIFFF